MIAKVASGLLVTGLVVLALWPRRAAAASRGAAVLVDGEGPTVTGASGAKVGPSFDDLQADDRLSDAWKGDVLFFE